MGRRAQDLTNMNFGMLHVVERAPNHITPNGTKKVVWECICNNCGKTGVMISHRISSARMSNKVIVLEGGKIIESGTHDELVELNGLYARLYNLQREKYTLKEEAK